MRLPLVVCLCGVSLCLTTGCGKEEKKGKLQTPPVASPTAAPAANAGGSAAASGSESAAPANEKSSILNRVTGEVIDWQAEKLKNADLVEIENKVSGDDPLSVAASTYVSATSRASVANFKHQVDIIRAMNDNNAPLTYKQFMQLKQQLNIQMSQLPPYQKYGYDSKTGGIIVVEDKADKARRYKEAGLSPDGK